MTTKLRLELHRITLQKKIEGERYPKLEKIKFPHEFVQNSLLLSCLRRYSIFADKILSGELNFCLEKLSLYFVSLREFFVQLMLLIVLPLFSMQKNIVVCSM